MFSTGFSSNDDAFVQKHVEFVESLMITVKWWDPKSGYISKRHFNLVCIEKNQKEKKS
jgi:hypothetical protein